jgi:diacylglycerol kinase (ATP)
LRRLTRATINTWNGLNTAARSEAAFRQELIVFLVAVPLAFVVASEVWTRVLLLAVILFVLVMELVNTAIEKLADRVNTAHDPQIGAVKDMSSAAVGLTILLAALVWLVALAQRFGLL